MKKFFSLGLPAVLAIVGAQAARAECSAFSCNAVSVSQLVMTGAGGFYVGTSGNEQLTGCTPNSGVYLYMANSGNFKEIYATLLAAQLSNRIVSIELNPSITATCTISYVTLTEQ